eukprot:135159-Rhodomonas_salina.7
MLPGPAQGHVRHFRSRDRKSGTIAYHPMRRAVPAKQAPNRFLYLLRASYGMPGTNRMYDATRADAQRAIHPAVHICTTRPRAMLNDLTSTPVLGSNTASFGALTSVTLRKYVATLDMVLEAANVALAAPLSAGSELTVALGETVPPGRSAPLPAYAPATASPVLT